MTGLSELHAYLSGWPLVGGLAGFGFCVGILTGLFGVGGGFVVTPMLNVLFGIDYSLAAGSSLCFTIGASSSGLSRHWRARNVETRTMVIMAIGAALGTLCGTSGHQLLRHSLHALGEGGFEVAMNILFILLLLPTALLIWRDNKLKKNTRLPWAQRMPWLRIALPTAGIEGVSTVALFILGFGVGILTGLMGIGGGVFLMPILVLFVGLAPHKAVGSNLGIVLVSSMIGTIRYGLHNHVVLAVSMALLVGSTIGIQVGAALSERLQARHLRRYFAYMVLLVIALIIWKTCLKLTHGFA